MQLPEEMHSQTGKRLPILSYAPADVPTANRWVACRVLPTLLTSSLLGWITAVNVYGLVYGGISRIEIAAAFFFALVLSVVSFVAELVLACATCGPHIEPRTPKAIIAATLLPPMLWLLLAWAQLHHRPHADILQFLLLGSVFVVPLLVLRREP